MLDTSAISAVLRAFLARPNDWQVFNAAWDMTIRRARLYLAIHGGRQSRQAEDFAGFDPLRDLAIEVTVCLFTSKRETEIPLHRALLPYEDAPDKELEDRFLAVLYKTIRQEMSKSRSNPELSKTRKNCRYAIEKSGEYVAISHNGGFEWRWSKATEPERREYPHADHPRLQSWAMIAVQNESQTPAQCRALYRQLDPDDRYRNMLAIPALSRAIATALVQWEAPTEIEPERPYVVRLRSSMRKYAAAVVRETLVHELPHLAKRAELTESEVAAVSTALETLIADFVEGFDHAKIPEYLREQMGDIPPEVYKTKFKYLWDTLVGDCRKRLLDKVKDDFGYGGGF